MIRIAFIIDSIDTAGAGTEKQLLMLLEGLDRSEFDPTLVCLRSSEWLDEQELPFQVEVLNVGSLVRWSSCAAVARIAQLQRQKGFDILQTFFIDANILGTIAGRFSRIPIVLSSRRNVGYWHTGAHRMLLLALRRWTTHYLANSRAVEGMLLRIERVPRDKVTVIYNGIDLDAFDHVDPRDGRRQRVLWGLSDKHTVVGTVANLRPVKNISSFIEAATKLRVDFPDLRFVVVGDGPERRNLETQIKAVGLDSRFLLVGSQRDVVPCLGAFDLAVQCSLSEGFSGALVEYMAAGLPIVASDVGGNREALVHGETGLLYQPDGASSLAACLRRLLNDRPSAERMARAARQAAFARFGRKRCINEHEAFYREIVGRRTPARR